MHKHTYICTYITVIILTYAKFRYHKTFRNEINVRECLYFNLLGYPMSEVVNESISEMYATMRQLYYPQMYNVTLWIS
jgi:hypothetical protein